jgi:hypothetical protein
MTIAEATNGSVRVAGHGYYSLLIESRNLRVLAISTRIRKAACQPKGDPGSIRNVWLRRKYASKNGPRRESQNSHSDAKS